MLFLKLYNTNLVKLISGFLVPVTTIRCRCQQKSRRDRKKRCIIFSYFFKYNSYLTKNDYIIFFWSKEFYQKSIFSIWFKVNLKKKFENAVTYKHTQLVECFWGVNERQIPNRIYGHKKKHIEEIRVIPIQVKLYAPNCIIIIGCNLYNNSHCVSLSESLC